MVFSGVPLGLIQARPCEYALPSERTSRIFQLSSGGFQTCPRCELWTIPGRNKIIILETQNPASIIIYRVLCRCQNFEKSVPLLRLPHPSRRVPVVSLNSRPMKSFDVRSTYKFTFQQMLLVVSTIAPWSVNHAENNPIRILRLRYLFRAVRKHQGMQANIPSM